MGKLKTFVDGQAQVRVPRFLVKPIRQGLKLAKSIGIEELNDGSALIIVFRNTTLPRKGDRRG